MTHHGYVEALFLPPLTGLRSENGNTPNGLLEVTWCRMGRLEGFAVVKKTGEGGIRITCIKAKPMLQPTS
jgi:hypothetical protein